MKKKHVRLRSLQTWCTEKYRGFRNIGSWKGSMLTMGPVVVLLLLIQSYQVFHTRSIISVISGALLLFFVIFLITGLITLIAALMRLIPILYLWAALCAFFLLCFIFYSHMQVTIVFSILVLVFLTLTGQFLFYLFKHIRNGNKKRAVLHILILFALVSVMAVGMYWLNNEGVADPSIAVINSTTYERNTLDIEDPSIRGPYSVHRFTYGSGLDRHRMEYGQDAQLFTSSVDASPFVEKWSWLRRGYLGFGPEEMPLNAQVYYPDGEGPFPLVVIAHGNHLMTDYSDTGYGYLGELLASRGYIFVSVDNNFLNLSAYNDLFSFSLLEEENDARAWILLKHIEQWNRWNRDTESMLFNKVNMDNISLIGHSRGGEAVAIAAAFNTMTNYPDNGNISFDFNFGIKSIIAIAPTDGQYKPMDKSIMLTDVSYLTLHGSHDMDVTTFVGLEQYQRISFGEMTDHFKASVYIHGANHGQFNVNWGRKDGPGLGIHLTNRRQLISGKDQRHAAQVVISGFLDATLKNQADYIRLFKDIHYTEALLPEMRVVSNYSDGKTVIIANYEEDIHINSTTIQGGDIQAKNFVEWNEQKIQRKSGKRNHHAVYLNWDREQLGDTPVYSIRLPEDRLITGKESAIIFSMADASANSKEYRFTDLTVGIEDVYGNEARLPMSTYIVLHPMITGDIFKVPFANLMDTREPVFQYFQLSMSDFQGANPDLVPNRIVSLSFIFDRTTLGTIYIDDVGIRNDGL